MMLKTIKKPVRHPVAVPAGALSVRGRMGVTVESRRGLLPTSTAVNDCQRVKNLVYFIQ